MKDYYYLLAGLPDIDPDQEKYKIDFSQVYDTIMENLSGEDLHLVRHLIYPHDNKNLVRAIALQRNLPAPYPVHVTPAILSEEQAAQYHKSTDPMPEYMVNFLEEHGDILETEPVSMLETRLSDHFFAQVMKQKDSFLQAYYQFLFRLDNIKAAYNARLFDYELVDHINQEFDINRYLIKSTSSDFGLSQQYPFMEDLNAGFEQRNGMELEKKLESIIWSFVDEQTSTSFFNRHQVMAYLVKLLYVKRWNDLEPEKGKQRLQEITEKILNTEHDER